MKGHIVLKNKEHAKRCFEYLLSLGYKGLPKISISTYIELAFEYDYCKDYKPVFVVGADGYIYIDSDIYEITKRRYPIEIKYTVNCMDIE